MTATDEEAIFAAMRSLWARSSFTFTDRVGFLIGQYTDADGRRYYLDNADDRRDLEAKIRGLAPTPLNPDP